MGKYGRYLEEFKEGEEITHWPGKTILESDNNLFSLLTMNHHPVHLDVEYCKNHQHGRILVVGTYVFSLVVGLTVSEISGRAIANLEYEAIKHLKPVFIGDTIYARSRVLSVRDSKSKSDRGIVKVETTGYNQHQDAVLSFTRKVLIPKEHA
ncbi:MAG: MaoC family dehydratase [Candidatus Cyclobacteriaceae bacterium M3_2C_046]